MDLEALTIAGVAPKIKSKKISPVALIRSHLERIERLNPLLNLYQTLAVEQALADAEAAEKEIRRGKYRGPLHGIPFSIKDNIAARGVRTTAGSKILAEWIPDFDATVVARLKESGGILLGKNNMHEWASGGTTINPYYGASRNPWDTSRVTGGSSGGSAAAVAASLCLLSIGTDNAGSVRNPASQCGTVGLKATYGRVSRFGGVLGTGGFSTDHFGIMTKTVRDCAIVLKAIAGRDARDPLSADVPVPDYTKSLVQAVKGLRVGLVKGYYDEIVSAEVRKTFYDAVKFLESLGMRVKDLSIPHSHLIPAVHTATSRVENVSTQDQYLRLRPRDYSRVLLYRHVTSLTIPAATYVQAQRVRRLICREFDQALETVDVIAAPTVTLPAPTIEECERGVLDFDGKQGKVQTFTGSFGVICTTPFNVTGLPALSLCCGFSSRGMPIGFQIAGRSFEENMVFRVSHAYERAAGWHEKKPRLPLGM